MGGARWFGMLVSAGRKLLLRAEQQVVVFIAVAQLLPLLSLMASGALAARWQVSVSNEQDKVKRQRSLQT